MYDAEEREWRDIGSMQLARSSHKMAVVGGRLVAIAGEMERHDHPVPVRRAEDLPFPQHIPLQARQLGGPQPAVRGIPVDNVQAGNGHANANAHAPAGNLPPVMRLPQQNPVAQRVGNNRGHVAGGMGLVHGDPARVTPMIRGSHANASMEVYNVESDSWALVPDSWLSGNKVSSLVSVLYVR